MNYYCIAYVISNISLSQDLWGAAGPLFWGPPLPARVDPEKVKCLKLQMQYNNNSYKKYKNIMI